MIKILFFAALREQLGSEGTLLPSENISSVEQVIDALIVKNPHWQVAFKSSLLCAVNQEMVNKSHSVITGDEVAFFPPVTGG
jgi:molybdopterin synthase sulfur carrier subunit